ncbi:carboxypeptidase regulatory-like domain-containing protein [Aquimarina megaterium]|uniref:carboxypeptidase regulatory-like domain-containing protein n=1 Tax=Aquimarina megaterium TaxID=1443666 RepID=UPI00094219BD|nr:carboxypeptidase regulatory-like domain-containing protein [Aquimarina megaterium]
MKKVFLLLLILCGACNDDDKTEDPVLCTLEARPGLEVTIKDTTDATFLVEGITVVATDNEYKETLENISGTTIFVGAHERTGTYVITVSKTGYTTITSDPIIVKEDICHVITESLEILLEKK